jgi:hypothetical protein
MDGGFNCPNAILNQSAFIRSQPFPRERLHVLKRDEKLGQPSVSIGGGGYTRNVALNARKHLRSHTASMSA